MAKSRIGCRGVRNRYSGGGRGQQNTLPGKDRDANARYTEMLLQAERVHRICWFVWPCTTGKYFNRRFILGYALHMSKRLARGRSHMACFGLIRRLRSTVHSPAGYRFPTPGGGYTW